MNYNNDRVYDSLEKINISYENQNIFTYIARAEDEKKRGLSIFDTLPVGQAMLFVYEKESIQSFWMKDMKFSIDIIWLNKDKEVIYINQHADPANFPEIYTPDKKSLYVLEFNDGFVKKNNINIGDRFDWN